MDTLFKKSIKEIQNFYDDYEYKLGWRFLNCSKDVLANNPQVAFITLNPGGSEIPEDHPWASCEDGNSYLTECWGDYGPGMHFLQKQIRMMFGKLAKHINYPHSPDELLENTLSGYFIPFRSARYNDLPYKKDALQFAFNLWEEILRTITPRLIMCIDKEAYKCLKVLIEDAYGIPMIEAYQLDTGWGTYQVDINIFGEGDKKVKLLRLPHLSTFKLFTRAECAPYLEHIFKIFSS